MNNYSNSLKVPLQDKILINWSIYFLLVLDTRALSSADIGSDRNLVLSKLRIKTSRFKRKSDTYRNTKSNLLIKKALNRYMLARRLEEREQHVEKMETNRLGKI